MYQIIPSSKKLTKPEPKQPKRNYPWDQLECGQSFAINKSEIKIVTLRPLCSAKGKALNKRFKVVEHEAVFEVGRVS